MQTTRLNDADPYWAWHDRLGIKRPGGPPARDPRYRVGKDGRLFVDLDKPYRPPRVATAADGRVVATFHAPAPAAPRLPPVESVARWRDNLAAIKSAISDVEKRLDGEWREFADGRHALPRRADTLKLWRNLSSDAAVVEHVIIPARLAQPAVPCPAHHYPDLLLRLNKLHERRRCYWCGDVLALVAMNRDHVIPLWIRRQMGLGKSVGQERVCRTCNTEKGGMPPALFARIRLNAVACASERELWGDICRRIQGGEHGSLLDYAVAEMQRPVPPMKERLGLRS